MLKENNYKGQKIRNEDSIDCKGIICGVNIKPIKTKTKEKAWVHNKGWDSLKTIIKWGLFIHIRMEDGIQYDSVFFLAKTFSYDDPTDIETSKKKYKNRGSSFIPSIIKALGVNEWVELIGTKVVVRSNDNIYPAENGFSFRAENSVVYLMPSYYEIDPHKQLS